MRYLREQKSVGKNKSVIRMMDLYLSPAKLLKQGIEALVKELGPIGMARFLQQFETGAGGYTKERQSWLKGEDAKSIVKEITKKRMKS